ncbi:hypothetical protein HK100_008764 [Physocladia obscura]|uniref:RhoGAP-domain-containing protein n=1 Tax=Physocladia obscura TaxID=109957 RepID=A0AAD5T4J3_9FUNG|nr:hypothetical protein HK100_008764 [Physocladia obscura]
MSQPLPSTMPEFREVVDPSTGTTFFLNIATGGFQWDRPIEAIVHMRNSEGADDEWWELHDDARNLPYYYNTGTGQTEWRRPLEGVVIPLRSLQSTAVGKQMTSALKRMSTMSSTMLGSSHSSEDESDGSIARSQISGEAQLVQQQPFVQSQAQFIPQQQQPPLAPSPLRDRAPSLNSFNNNNNINNNNNYNSGSSNRSRFEHLGMVSGGSSSAAASVTNASNTARASTSSSIALMPPSMLIPRDSSGELKQQEPSPQLQQHPMSPITPSETRSNRPPRRIVEVPYNQNLASLPKVKPDFVLPDTAHINKFKIDGYAKDHFTEMKRGLFIKHTVSVEEALMYQKDTLRGPLLENLPKHLHKDAIKSFRLIKHIMSDVSQGPPYTGSIREVQSLLNMGVTSKFLRDEIYVQIMKQVRGNTLPESVFRGWLLLCVVTIVFPPSKDLEEYVKAFTLEHYEGVPAGSWGTISLPNWATKTNSRENEAIAALAKYCNKKLIRICRSGPRGKTPMIQEIERAQEAPFRASLFGETLEDVMAVQAKENPKDSAGRKLALPRILLFLTDAILTLNGCKTEGIFRVPGDIDMVNELRIRLERGKYDVTGISDPHVASSLLKLWLRELAEPLIPADLYDDCIDIGREATIPESEEDVGALAYELIGEMPDINRRVALYMLNFLKVVADPQNQSFTRMTHANIALVFAPNFLRCPSDDPVVIFENTNFEQAFIRNQLQSPLLENVPRHLHKEAVRSFELINHIMADVSNGPPYHGSIKEVQILLNIGVTFRSLRSEIYMQVLNQVSRNKSSESVFRGWLLFSVLTTVFPPSKDCESVVKDFAQHHFDGVPANMWPESDIPTWCITVTEDTDSINTSAVILSRENEAIARIAKFCFKKLASICSSGIRYKTPTISEIERAQEAPFRTSLFGETLQDLMTSQTRKNPKDGTGRRLAMPRILLFLSDAIIRLNGSETDDIFGVPDDSDLIKVLRERLERGKYDMGTITSPHVPAALLKLWFHELAEPLVPVNLYENCLEIGRQFACSDLSVDSFESLLSSMPDINKKVLLYMGKFLNILGKEEKHTCESIATVLASTFLRSPIDEINTPTDNISMEQAFLLALMQFCSQG